MTDSLPALEIDLDLDALLAAAQKYEREHSPRLWRLRQTETAAWGELLQVLDTAALKPLLEPGQALAFWPEAEALPELLLATPLPLLESLLQALKAQLPPAAEFEGAELSEPPPQVALLELFHDVLEAHCFGSAPRRAPEILRTALQTLQVQDLTPLQTLTADLPTQGSELEAWLQTQSPKRLTDLRDGCYEHLQTLRGPQRQIWSDLLVCLNSSLLLQG